MTEPSSTDRWKIAITHTRFQYSGGSEKYIHSLVGRLLERGHEVHIFCHRHENYEHPKLTFHRVPWRRFPKFQRIRNFDAQIRRAVDPSEFDLVHGFTKTQSQDIFTDGSGTGIEYIDANWAHLPSWRRALIRNSPHQRALLAMESARYQRGATRRVLTMSRFVRDQILARYPIEPERVEVLYNGVETETFSPEFRETHGAEFRRKHEVDSDSRVVVFVGNDWRRKGLRVALEAFASYLAKSTSPRATLVVAGHDSNPDAYRAHARKLGVDASCRFVGPVREIRDAFAASDAFVFPTLYDVFGNVGLEAIASGVPAALSRRSGVAELLEPANAHGEESAGVILDNPEDSDELSRAMTAILDQDAFDERRAAARRLAEHYSWDDHFERVLEVYREVIAEKRAAKSGVPA